MPPTAADPGAQPERPVAGRGPRPGAGGPTGARPVAGRGDRTGARPAGDDGTPPTDRPSYHPRATANRTGATGATGARSATGARPGGRPGAAGGRPGPGGVAGQAGVTGTMAVGGRGFGVADRDQGAGRDLVADRRTGGDRGTTISGRGISDRGRRPMHPAERDAVYDTVDQAALSKIEVRDRDENATTYRRVGADGTTIGPRRPTGPGPGHRRPTGPNGPGSAESGPPGEPGRKVGTRGPRIWRDRPLWMRRLVVFGSLGTFLLIVAGCAILYAATKVPLPDSIKTDQSSIIYFSDGTTQLARLGTENRTDVSLSEVSKPAQQAVLAAEDKNFYNEPGISYRGMARALLVNVKSGSVQQGASTITQQYVKNAYLTQDRTFSRKIKEIVISVKLSHRYSKDQILEYYLNTIYFGRNSYGIYAASEAYFGIPPSQLTAAQGAILAGLIRQPNWLDPTVHRADSQARWKEVINTMISQKWLTSVPEYPIATVKPKPDGITSTNGNVQNRYIQDEVVNELKDHGISEQQIETGGLRIRTTIDPARQQAAVDAVNSVIGKIYPNPIANLKTGLVALNPANGEILAWYGGSQYGKNPQSPDPTYASFIDTVSGAKIPSGSTFKTVTLLTALTDGANLNLMYDAFDL